MQSQNEIAKSVPSSAGAILAIESPEQELTQALRRLQRAAWSEKIVNGGRTPLGVELEKMYRLLQNVQLSFGLTDQEIED
jgi:hypothetical protein